MTEEQKLAQATLDMFNWYDSAHLFTQDKPGCTRDHIVKILEQVANGEVTGAKANRFIGWAQGVLCMEGFIGLSDARNLNRKVIAAMNTQAYYQWGSMMGTFSVKCTIIETNDDQHLIEFEDSNINEMVVRWVDKDEITYGAEDA